MEKGFLYLFLFGFVIVSGCAVPDVSEMQPQATGSQASIGYIGCSNTKQALLGYHLVGGANLWAVDERTLHDYDGGAVLDWRTDGNKFWDAFDKYLAENPETTRIWWQLCIRQDEAEMTYEDAVPVVEAVRKRIPDVIIYVSPLAEYTENVCEITGTEGIERAKSLAQELDSRNEDVFPGPVLGPLSLAEITTEEEDRCHLNEKGMRRLGEQLKQFFDNPEAEAIEENPSVEDSEPTPEEEELTFEEQVWQQRIDAAFEPSDCQQVSGPKYGNLYYTGPLIDSHYHIANIPDHPPGETDDYTDEVNPVLGINIVIPDIVCTLEQENTKKVFAFFPVYPEIPLQMLEVVNRTMQLYPENFVPFIMPPDNDNSRDGSPTVDAETLREMLNVNPSLFRGYGEIGLYARDGGAAELPPDSQRLLDIYPVVREHNLVVYFHLGEGHKDNFERILEQNPDINFIWHGDQLISYDGGKQDLKDVEDIISNHPNVFYTIDELYGDEWLIRPEVTKEEFLAHLENYEALLKEDLATWKAAIERHPDQFMWGTDRSDQVVWSHDPEVGQALANYGRAFIARLSSEVQEKFAYKNAERLITEQ